MVTRMGLVVKNEHFTPQNGDENGSRRQNRMFFAWKSWRERVSSSKPDVFRLKKLTRKGLVVKIEYFSP